jgi:ubiquinone/menaquinone biosynthesis C-methylase UbiE
MDIRNPFRASWVAERYAIARPNIHRQVMDHVRRVLPDEDPKELGLDIGCGTGLSTLALAAVASQVVGLDTSWEMLAQAPVNPQIRYVRALAEELPFRRGVFDIATVGCTFHWCRPTELLDEIHRVLRSRGWLVIYDNGFMGPTEAFPEMECWYRDVFRDRYPAPPRNPQFHPFMATTTGFRVVASEFLQQAVPFKAQELATYLTTQSNVVAAVEQGAETLEDAERWLVGQLSGLYRGLPGSQERPSCRFTFGGYVSCLRRAE